MSGSLRRILRRRRPADATPPGERPHAVDPADLEVVEPPARQIFRDPDLDAQLRRQGFVRLALFTPEEARFMADAYFALDEGGSAAAYGDYHELIGSDPDRKRSVQDLLRPRFEARAAELFADYVPRATSFIKKPSGECAPSEPHMDPSFVDETATRSVMIWCSLTGVQVGGGLLWFVPGSHRLGPRRRAHLDPTNSFCELEADIASGLGVPVELEPGEAVIFDHSTMHWADPNTSGSTRLVAQSALTAREVPLRYVYSVEVGHGREYAVDEDFYLLFPLDSKPGPEVLARYELLGDRTLATAKAGRREFEALIPQGS